MHADREVRPFFDKEPMATGADRSCGQKPVNNLASQVMFFEAPKASRWDGSWSKADRSIAYSTMSLLEPIAAKYWCSRQDP